MSAPHQFPQGLISGGVASRAVSESSRLSREKSPGSMVLASAVGWAYVSPKATP